MARNYKKEYAARREYLKAYRKKNKDKDKMRTRARRKMKCSGGKEVDHKDNNPKNNKRSNLRCVSRKRIVPKVREKLTLNDDSLVPES